MLTWLPERVRSARTVSAVGLGALLLFFAPLTVVRNTEWRDVDTLLRATVRDNATSPRVVFLHARDLRDQGKIAESLAEAQRAMRLQPNSPDAWYLAGRNYADLGKKAEALDAYQHAVKLARSPKASWLNDYAVALIQNGRAAEAGPVLEDAMRRDPDNDARPRQLRAVAVVPAGDACARHGVPCGGDPPTPRRLHAVGAIGGGAAGVGGCRAGARAGHAGGIGGAHQSGGAAVPGARIAEASGRVDEAIRVYRELSASPEADESLRDRVRTALRRVGAVSE